MAAQNAIRFLVGQELDEAFALEHRLGAGIAHEAELAHLVGAAFGLELFLGLADIGDFGGGVDHAGDHIVVHMARLAGEDFGHGHALILGLVGQHRAGNGIADGVETLDIGGKMGIGLDLAARQHRDPQRLQPQTGGVGFAARGQQHDVGLLAGFGIVLFQRPAHRGPALGHVHALHGGTKDKGQALLCQNPLKCLGNFTVHAGGDGIQIFHHRHLRAQPGIDRAHFQPDHPGPDHDHGLGDFPQRQRAGGGDDGHLVHRHTGQAGGFRPGGDDDGFRLMQLFPHLDLSGGGDAAPAFQPGYLVLLEQEFDALGVLPNHIILVALHLGPIDLGGGGHQAHLRKILLRLVQHVAGVQQGFRRDAADVQAGAAEGVAPFDHGHLQAKLRAADGADIAAWTGAEDDHVKAGHGMLLGSFPGYGTHMQGI